MKQVILRGIQHVDRLLEGKYFLLVRGNSYERINIRSNIDHFPHVEFTDFTPNPLREQVDEGIELFKLRECDCIVSVGGGSAIDVAKCIKLYSESDVPLIAIPTTAGSGSESTCHAVVYENGTKQSISHPGILPDYVILEPSVLGMLPSYQRKCTMLDALCQAIESWWSVNSTEESIHYSKQAIAIIRKNWKDYIEHDKESVYEDIMLAANYAGRAICITATTAAHAMSYKLTSLYHIPHGHAVSLCLPGVWEFMKDNIDMCTDLRGPEYLAKTLKEIEEYFSLQEFRNLLSQLQLNAPFPDEIEFDEQQLARSVNMTRMGNHPVTFSQEVLKTIYRRIMKNEG